MFASQRIAMSGDGSEFVTVTEGTTGPTEGQTYYGYSDGTYPVAFGSRTPTTFNGVTIKEVYRRTGGTTLFLIVLDGNRAQDWFTSMDIEGHGVVTTAAANFYTYDGGADVSYWSWNIDVTQWDGSGTSYVRLYE